MRSDRLNSTNHKSQSKVTSGLGKATPLKRFTNSNYRRKRECYHQHRQTRLNITMQRVRTERTMRFLGGIGEDMVKTSLVDDVSREFEKCSGPTSACIDAGGPCAWKSKERSDVRLHIK